MLENKDEQILGSNLVLISLGSLIVALSLFLQSYQDIGADSGVYLEIGRKIALNGKYYYDFFESNLPLSFYFYAGQYFLANLLNINPIILSQILINLLGLISIFSSAKILQNSNLKKDKILQNFLLISFFLGFFLRPGALQINEFGTKTSLSLLLFYPYFSYLFCSNLTNKSLFKKGILMALLPCLKPHYLILVAGLEICKFWQIKNKNFFYQIDKITALVTGILYLIFMVIFTPEFFKFMVPMWSSFYPAFSFEIFVKNSSSHLASRILPFGFLFLIFSKIKANKNDQIFISLFICASLLLISENIKTIDQIALFYAISCPAILAIIARIITTNIISFKDNLFIILALFIIPIFELSQATSLIYSLIFSFIGLVNLFWILAILHLFKTKEKSSLAIFISFLLILIWAIYFLEIEGILVVNLSLILAALYLFEKNSKDKISLLSKLTIIAAIAIFSFNFDSSIYQTLKKESKYYSPSKFTNFQHYYAQKYAPKQDDNIIVISQLIAHAYPAVNYLQKSNLQKSHTANFFLRKTWKSKIEKETNDYLLNDFKEALKSKKTKLIFVNNILSYGADDVSCKIGFLENYFTNQEIREIFVQNFTFKNRFLDSQKVKIINVKNKTEKFSNKIIQDFEVYVRK